MTESLTPTYRTFKDLYPKLISQTILEAINGLGFDQMTPVQAATMPLFLTHKDVCVEACTGSGKTLAFLVPIIEMILRRETKLKQTQVGSIVIAPTRELAMQIFNVAQYLVKFVGLKVLLLVGGTAVEEGLESLQSNGADILIATPGRLKDMLIRCDFLNLRELECLVLDEADTLLDMGFESTINDILGFLPKQRRTGLFSATQTREVRALARAGLRNPATISVKVLSELSSRSQATPSTLQNYYICCNADEKLSQLIRFLRDHTNEKIIVFFITCASVDFFEKVFNRLSLMKQLEIPVFGFHGRMVQKKRNGIYQQFLNSKSGVLLCTDVAARGIDIPDIDWIIQMDPPQDPSFFVHRVGRTARAGKQGNALCFLLPEEDAYVNFLNIKQVPMSLMQKFDDAVDVLPEVKELVLNDRDVLEKGTRAFVSYIRAYKEHQCQFIFRFASLPIGDTAHSFSLLKIPKIPEIRQFDNINFVATDIDTANIKYLDKSREQARQKKIQKQQQELKEEVQEEKNKVKTKKKQNEIGFDNGQNDDNKKRKRKSKSQQLLSEWDELAEEERLYKRMKKKKISRPEYEDSLKKIEENQNKVAKKNKKISAKQKKTKIEQISKNKSKKWQIRGKKR